MFKRIINIFSSSDWQGWGNKLKWQLISFKFLAFWAFVGMLIAAFRCLWDFYFKTIDIATGLCKAGLLSKADLSQIIMHTQSVIFDSAFSHVLLFAGTAITSIIAIKGVNYYTDNKRTVEAIRRMDNTTHEAKEDLKKFIQPGN
jgi:hypothetical protein